MSRWSGKAKKSQIDATGCPAVDRDAYARDERGSRRYEKAHEIGDVLGRRDALQRVVLDSFCPLLVHALSRQRRLRRDQSFPPRGRRGRRRNRGDEDSGRPTEIRQSPGEVDESGIRDAARKVARGRIASGRADDVHDPSATLRLHHWKHGARHPHVAEDLQAPVARPLLVGNLQEVAAADGARVVDQDVEPAEPVAGGRRNPVHVVESAQVAGKDEHLGARLRLDLVRGLFEPRLVAGADRDPRAFGGEAERDGPTDALATSGHERGLAGQLQIHVGSFLRTAPGKAGTARQSNSSSRPSERRTACANGSRSIPSSRRPRSRPLPSSSSARAPAKLPLARCWYPTATWISPCSASRSSPRASRQNPSSSSCTSKNR